MGVWGSTTTGEGYASWDELVAAEANGWAVVVLLRQVGLQGRTFARTVGPFETKTEARNKASALRRQMRRELVNIELLGVHVEPLWKGL